MDDIACPRCKTTKYRNPSLKLLVNICGHGLCENCVELLFVKGSGSCPQCEVPLRRNQFRLQIFEDASVEKELDIRKRILKDFNKKEEDFSNLREYNDYLEEVETIIFNLSNNINIEATKRKIEQYKKENKNIIMKRKNKLSKDEEEIDEYLELESNEKEWRRQQLSEEEREIKRSRVMKKEALIDDLMFSDLPAGQILASHGSLSETENTSGVNRLKPPPRERVKFSSGIKMNQNLFLPLPKVNENIYTYVEPTLSLHGPGAPDFKSIEKDNYLLNIRATSERDRAGGFVSHYACRRALQESFCGLFLTSDMFLK
ncbi:CDK-activating kinase assembly factor MAT1 [Centruroides vittatus]|uniref:CDK-activating kinase assembly factor MAT1 n=1 Tax=Centruroides vittatus TaxID=120091 RepID=UPI00350F910A